LALLAALPISPAGAQANGGYVGNALAAGAAVTGVTLYSPNYQSPRSYQMNVGFQHELKHGTIVSVDYLRNVGVHTLLAIDENHVGDAKFVDPAGAAAAIAATNSSFGCGGAGAGVIAGAVPTAPT